mgnify:CR=1 FL=1
MRCASLSPSLLVTLPPNLSPSLPVIASSFLSPHLAFPLPFSLPAMELSRSLPSSLSVHAAPFSPPPWLPPLPHLLSVPPSPSPSPSPSLSPIPLPTLLRPYLPLHPSLSVPPSLSPSFSRFLPPSLPPSPLPPSRVSLSRLSLSLRRLGGPMKLEAVRGTRSR